MQNAIFLITVASMLAPGQAADQRVAPVSLLEAAASDPMSFARVLLETGIPAGVELRQRDRLRTATDQSQRWGGVKREQLQREPTVLLSDVVTRFNDRQSSYFAKVDGGVVVIRPRGSTAQGYLDTFSSFGQIAALSSMDLARQIFAPMDPSVDLAGGRPSSGLGTQVETRFVSVNGSGKTVVSVLNEIVAMTGDQAWLVITSDNDPAHILRFGFLNRDGSGSLLSVR